MGGSNAVNQTDGRFDSIKRDVNGDNIWVVGCEEAVQDSLNSTY